MPSILKIISPLRHARLAFIAFALFCSALTVLAGQGAQRMLYTVPNSTFIEKTSGDSVVTVNDSSGLISTLQTSINDARSANPNSDIVIRLSSGATYWV